MWAEEVDQSELMMYSFNKYDGHVRNIFLSSSQSLRKR